MKQKLTPFTHVRDAKQFTKFAHLNLVRNPGVPMYKEAAKAASAAYLDARNSYLVQDETANIILDGMLAGTIEGFWDAASIRVRQAYTAAEDAKFNLAQSPRNRSLKALSVAATEFYSKVRSSYLATDKNSILLLDAMLAEVA